MKFTDIDILDYGLVVEDIDPLLDLDILPTFVGGRRGLLKVSGRRKGVESLWTASHHLDQGCGMSRGHWDAYRHGKDAKPWRHAAVRRFFDAMSGVTL